MKCNYCGAEFEGNFCSRCGAGAEDGSDGVYRQNTVRKASRKKPFYLRWWFIALVIVAVIAVGSYIGNLGEKIVWEDIVLGEVLPEPSAGRGEIHANSSEGFRLELNSVSAAEYSRYIEACKEKGFTVDSESDYNSYSAYNAEGFKLSLRYYSSSESMSVDLETPMEMHTIVWPVSAAGQQLPSPESNVGRFSFEYDDSFFVYVGGTPKEAYSEYVNACSDAGFNVDFNKGEDYYFAHNAEGWYVSLRYEGNNIMSININAPDEEESATVSSATEAAVTEPSETPDDDGASDPGIDPDFRKAMDSYEEFMDEYVDFMVKFSNSDGTDLGLLAEYAEYMADYAEFCESFEGWEDEDLNDAETAYYIEVQARVNKKLLELTD